MTCHYEAMKLEYDMREWWRLLKAWYKWQLWLKYLDIESSLKLSLDILWQVKVFCQAQNHFLTKAVPAYVRSGVRIAACVCSLYLLCTASWIVNPGFSPSLLTSHQHNNISPALCLTRPQLHIFTAHRRHHTEILLSSWRTEMGLGHLKEAEKDTVKRYKHQTLRNFTVFTGHIERSQAMSRDVTNISASARRKSTTLVWSRRTF